MKKGAAAPYWCSSPFGMLSLFYILASAAAVVVVCASASVAAPAVAAAYEQQNENDNPPATVISFATTHNPYLLLSEIFETNFFLSVS